MTNAEIELIREFKKAMEQVIIYNVLDEIIEEIEGGLND
jgi:hypothetical protein